MVLGVATQLGLPEVYNADSCDHSGYQVTSTKKMKTKENLLKELKSILNWMLIAEEKKKIYINAVKADFRNSAINLVDYLALHSQNIVLLQKHLHYVGLSSLASSESHIKTQVINIMHWLGNEKLSLMR